MIDDESEHESRRSRGRRASDRQSWVTILGSVVAALSLVGAVFSAGYSWRRIDEVATNQVNTIKRVDTLETLGYQRETRVSVNEEQIRQLRIQLERIENKLDRALAR